MISVFVQLTLAGTDVGPFTIIPLPNPAIVWGVSRIDLLYGQTYSVPDNTNIIRIQSTGICTNYIDLIIGTTTTTTTTTAIPGTTTTTSSTTTEYVPVEYWNTQQSGYFCKNDCEPPLYGTCLFYTVVAHTYSSWVSQQDADNQALADIDLNGQTWVNENATCQADPPPATTTTTSSTTTTTTTEVPPTTTTTTTTGEPGTTTTTTTGEPGTTTTTTTGEPGTTTTTTTEACIPANGTLTFVESGSDDTTYRGTFTIDISPTTYGVNVYAWFTHDWVLDCCGVTSIAIEILAGQTSGDLYCYLNEDTVAKNVTFHYNYYGGIACLTVDDLTFEVPAATPSDTTTTTTTEEPGTTTTTTTVEPEVTTTTTTTEDPGYVSLGVKLGIAWPGVCSEAEVTRYSSTVFGVGITLYTDTGLTTPVTGYGIVVDYGGSKSTYNLNSLTGVVGSAEGNTCA